jgi:uncharacterized protein YlxP (DUF503 family)
MHNPDEGEMLRTQAIAEASFYPASFINRKKDNEDRFEDLTVVEKYFKEISSPRQMGGKRAHRRSKSTFQTSYNHGA